MEPGDEAAGARGGELQRGVGVLMDAMRDLLVNIQPVAPPREDQDDNVEDRVQDDEWD